MIKFGKEGRTSQFFIHMDDNATLTGSTIVFGGYVH